MQLVRDTSWAGQQRQFLGPLNAQGIVPGSAFLMYSGAYILDLLAVGVWKFGRYDL